MHESGSLSPAQIDELAARLNLVDPTDPGSAGVKRPAARLSTLAGRRIALLENRKPNAEALLSDLARLLIARDNVAAADVRAKFIYSRPAALDIVDELAQYDAVVTAIGD